MDNFSNSYKFKYNGKEYDEETGNYYYSARYYDPKLSIFISVDPLAEETMDSYGYCYSNPVKLIDPTGMSAEPPSTHTDENGNVVAVYNDGDNSVYVHSNEELKGFNSETMSLAVTENTRNIGETEYWDEFVSPETGKTMTNYKIQEGKSFDPIIQRMHAKAEDMNLKEIAMASKGGQMFDIKKDYKNVGALLNGKYATSRSAGNFLAGYNAKGSTYFGISISFQTFQKLAGALHIEESGGNTLSKLQMVDIITFGRYYPNNPSDINKFVAPRWGEVDYQHRMSRAGWNFGKTK